MLLVVYVLLLQSCARSENCLNKPRKGNLQAFHVQDSDSAIARSVVPNPGRQVAKPLILPGFSLQTEIWSSWFYKDCFWAWLNILEESLESRLILVVFSVKVWPGRRWKYSLRKCFPRIWNIGKLKYFVEYLGGFYYSNRFAYLYYIDFDVLISLCS